MHGKHTKGSCSSVSYGGSLSLETEIDKMPSKLNLITNLTTRYLRILFIASSNQEKTIDLGHNGWLAYRVVFWEESERRISSSEH